MKLVLLHSPLVGSGTWKAVAALLWSRGHEAVTPDLAPVLRGDPPYYLQLAEAVASAADTSIDKTVLIVHSGAGALVPAVAARISLSGAVFVDALLPHPGRCWFETAPESLAARLRKLAKNGKLPPRDRWWPKDAIRTLLPEPAMYKLFAGELSELPLAFFEERAPAVPFATPSAYLQLSDGYKTEAGDAETNGRPVMRLQLHHLAMLTHPEVVAAEIESLCTAF